MGNGPIFKNPGYCYCCDQNVEFVAYGEWFRDLYICSNCRSIPRERALMLCIERFYPNWKDLIIHESSPAQRGTSVRLADQCSFYVPSQYFPDTKYGSFVKGVRCENLEELTFEDHSIDLHISQDVFEHLFHPDRAFREIARTLKPGGAHIFTTPLVRKNQPSFFMASQAENGEITYHAPPEYHGNPISDEGSLVTVHWGYDICQYIHDSSSLFTQMVYIDAIEFGIRAEYIEVLVTQKK